jgi:hypothetical protein
VAVAMTDCGFPAQYSSILRTTRTTTTTRCSLYRGHSFSLHALLYTNRYQGPRSACVPRIATSGGKQLFAPQAVSFLRAYTRSSPSSHTRPKLPAGVTRNRELLHVLEQFCEPHDLHPLSNVISWMLIGQCSGAGPTELNYIKKFPQ